MRHQFDLVIIKHDTSGVNHCKYHICYINFFISFKLLEVQTLDQILQTFNISLNFVPFTLKKI
jgi:hypothetical protein